jgi:hypothetical protein
MERSFAARQIGFLFRFIDIFAADSALLSAKRADPGCRENPGAAGFQQCGS